MKLRVCCPVTAVVVGPSLSRKDKKEIDFHVDLSATLEPCAWQLIGEGDALFWDFAIAPRSVGAAVVVLLYVRSNVHFSLELRRCPILREARPLFLIE